MSDQHGRILLANLFQGSRSTFLAQIFHAFLPSKQACEMYQFRHWGVRQQYPAVTDNPTGWIPVREPLSPPAPFDFARQRMLIIPRLIDNKLNLDQLRT